MAIVGEPLQNWVIDQINQRQKVYGSGETSSRTLPQISYLNSKTSFIKLASSVYFDNTEEGIERLKRMGLSASKVGNKLAKEYILFNGIGKKGNRAGIKGLTNNPAYGVGGTDFGYVPMPGIIDANIQYLNRGSLKKVDLKLKAHNKQQFDIIDALYLRLGYTVLLEYGHTRYLDGKGFYKTMQETLIDTAFFSDDSSKKSKFTSDDFRQKILKFRVEKSGNYDGMLGKISNFTWSLSPDGTYDISLTIMSQGDIIESLNIGQPPSVSSPIIDAKIAALDNIAQKFSTYYFAESVVQDLEKQKEDLLGVNRFHRLLNEITILKENVGIKSRDSAVDAAVLAAPIEIISDKYEYGVKTKNNVSVKCGYILNQLRFTQDDGSKVTMQDDTIYKFPIEGAQYVTISKGASGSYIRFGELLKFIQEICIPIGDGGKPIINIDYNAKTNICYTINDRMISLDPNICIIRCDNFVSPIRSFVSDYEKTEGDIPLIEEDRAQIFKGLNPFHLQRGGVTFGATMNIYLDVGFLKTKVFTQEGGEITKIILKNALDTICNEINRALGGINQLEPSIDEETNTIRIIENSTIPNVDKLYDFLGLDAPKDYNLILTGFRKKGSNVISNFVKNVSIETKVTKEYASMITIGATAGGYTPGEEATAFSKWNQGLTDRYKTNIGDALTGEPSDDAKDQIDKYQEIKDSYASYLTSGWNVLGIKSFFKTNIFDNSKENATPSDDIIKVNLESVSSYYEYKQAEIAASSSKASNQIGFLPVSINLELDGMSGIKIYNKLKLDTSVLPSNYPNTLDFVVTKVDHSLSSNSWTTNLELMPIPKSGNTSEPSFKRVFSTTSTTPTPSGTVSFSSSAPKQEEINNAKVRLKLKRILDDGRQTLGILQVYDENGNELYELKTVELPFLDNRNSISCVPTGKYLIRPRENDHYGKHFYLIGNDKASPQFSKIPNSNTSKRSGVLIHRAKDSTWLAGCIAPGTKFSTKTGGQEVKGGKGWKKSNNIADAIAGSLPGNPKGLLSKKDSIEAMNRLTNTLWKAGDSKDNSFFLVIENDINLRQKGTPQQLSALGIPPTIGT